jgi:hypothetical protein
LLRRLGAEAAEDLDSHTSTVMPYLHRLLIAIAVLSPLALTACDSSDPDDDNGLQGVAAWEGSYTGQSRFGGTSGTWGNGGTRPLVVSSSGQVTISGGLITGTYDEATSTFTWERGANATNGSIAFRETYASESFFGDLPNGTAGQNFTGFIRIGSDGPLDYRGVLR